MRTSSISCNEDSEVSRASEIPIIAVVGPEFVTGSTRMKSGTATKLILNMISTSVMIRLGRVKGNHMVDGNFRSFVDRSLKQYDICKYPVGIVGGGRQCPPTHHTPHL